METKEMQELFDEVAILYNKVNDFYMRQIFCGNETNPFAKNLIQEMIANMGSVNDIAIELEKYYCSKSQ